MSARWSTSDRRWFIDGKPVHAGNPIEIRGVHHRPNPASDGNEIVEPGDWFRVRVESRNAGRELDAYFNVGGLDFRRQIAGFDSDGEPWAWEGLRWPPAGIRPLTPADQAISARNQLLQVAATLVSDAIAADGEHENEYGQAMLHDDWHNLAAGFLQKSGKLPRWDHG